MSRIALIGCSKSKRTVPSQARDLYQGNLFRAARRVADAQFDDWFVLSAKFGLVPQGTVIPPYDQTLTTMTRKERFRWAVGVERDIRAQIQPGSTLVFFAGSAYREFLFDPLSMAYTVEVPLKGLFLGQQVAALNKMARVPSP